jgi:hypothetical protein
MDTIVSQLSSNYGVIVEEIEQAKAMIEEIEKISYPNI